MSNDEPVGLYTEWASPATAYKLGYEDGMRLAVTMARSAKRRYQARELYDHAQAAATLAQKLQDWMEDEDG